MAIRSDVQYVRYYTAGSAARELAPQTPLRTKTAAKPHKQKKLVVYIDPVAIVGVLTAVILVIGMVFGLVHLSQLQDDAAAMQDYVLELEAENASMLTRYRSGYDVTAVEKTAVALGMVPADQVTHVQIAD